MQCPGAALASKPPTPVSPPPQSPASSHPQLARTAALLTSLQKWRFCASFSGSPLAAPLAGSFFPVQPVLAVLGSKSPGLIPDWAVQLGVCQRQMSSCAGSSSRLFVAQASPHSCTITGAMCPLSCCCLGCADGAPAEHVPGAGLLQPFPERAAGGHCGAGEGLYIRRASTVAQ